MSSTQFTSRSRTINKKHEKQRPLRIVSRHSIIDGRVTTAEDLVSLVDDVTTQLSSGIHDLRLQQNVISMCNALKCCAHQFEVVYKDQLDRAFVAIRNGSQDERLDLMTRIHLLELIELRAKQWRHNDSMDSYYSAKLSNLEEQSDSVTMESSSISMGSSIMGGLSSPSTPPILGTGDVLKNSGKFSKPTRIPGKNYCKDEVVIRNSDSGKVMGIKGRRVHMIEELSETIISFQRVNPGAKERLVQITGTSEDKIHYAKDLIKETIQRNASPVRGVEKASGIGDSSSSLNSSASDEIYQQINSSKSFHNISSGDTSFGEYKHTVTVGNLSLKITGSNLTLVRTAKLVLDEHFSKWTGDLDQPGDGIEYFRFPEEPPVPEIPFQELPNNQNYPDIIHSNVNEIAETLPEAEIQSANKTSVPMELTYEFLLTCATGPYAKRVPANWERIQREFPNIVRKSGEVLEIYKGRSIAASVVSFAANDNELE